MLNVNERNRHDLDGQIAIKVPARYPERDQGAQYAHQLIGPHWRVGIRFTQRIDVMRCDACDGPCLLFDNIDLAGKLLRR